VVAFCRIDDKEIRLREPIMQPDALIIQDATLLHQVDVFSGLKKDGYILINTTRTFEALGLGEFARDFRPERLLTVPASELAMKHVGRPVPNVPLLGAFAALGGLISLDAVQAAIRQKFKGAVAQGNMARPARPTKSSWNRKRRQRPTCLNNAKAPMPWRGGRAEPPRGDLRLPDLAPDAHRRRAGRNGEIGALSRCEFINVESEFAAMSVAIGASAAGARAYTATASQGLLFMAEAVYNASGLGLPIVMTVANRAIGAPINIWNDHTDSMSMRDAGWLQLFAETNQEALDLHIQAFRIAEELSLAGHGVHGWLHPDPRLRARGHAGSGAGGPLPAAL
jgi:2-oxoacid:acceptor oxidoreductase gamma subunit (pyruvate/2-ketoisovalerate family)